jgi:hypothetical protein
MNTPLYDRDALLDLAADYLHGTITAADGAKLEALLAASARARRDFVDYCMLHGQIALTTAAVGPGGTRRRAGWPLPGIGRVAAMLGGLVLAAASLMLLVTAGREAPPPTPAAGSYDTRQLPLVTVASLEVEGEASRPISPSTLRPDRPTALRSASGADVNVAQAAVFGVTARDAGALYDGSVQARLTEPDANFSITAANLRIVDKGTAFRVDRIDDEHVAVTVLDGEVEVQSRVRLPVCYWPFDDAMASSSRVADVVGGLSATLDSNATPVTGLVGAGALRFDNTRSAEATITGGTGDKVGMGLLAMAEGITIEAMIASAWSGRFGDYDEIFRKEDGDARVLLSFQNDGTNFSEYTEPHVKSGPCLSFGLHLAGRGYGELDMPLDGLDGRPTLAEITDGKPHHVVATYDSFTGRKAIFIDGRLRFSHDYRVGTMVLSGGPVAAKIGNHGQLEPFTGVIDELALYDFALTPAEIAEHWGRAAAGENYFGVKPPAPGAPRWQAVTRLVEGQSRVFNQATGLAR